MSRPFEDSHDCASIEEDYQRVKNERDAMAQENARLLEEVASLKGPKEQRPALERMAKALEEKARNE